MFGYEDKLEGTEFTDWKRQFPTLRENVYTALKDLTPSRTVWNLEHTQGSRVFNQDYVDSDTQRIIVSMLAEELGNSKLRLTREELCFAFFRFKELIMLADCVEQGIFTPIQREDGSMYYKAGDTETPRLVGVPNEFLVKVPANNVTVRIFKR